MLIDHSEKGSSGLLLERRTGALMADISMEDFGCVAISPLWLGGVAKQARPASPSSRDDKNTLHRVMDAQHHLHHVMIRPPFHRVMDAASWADAPC